LLERKVSLGLMESQVPLVPKGHRGNAAFLECLEYQDLKGIEVFLDWMGPKEKLEDLGRRVRKVLRVPSGKLDPLDLQAQEEKGAVMVHLVHLD